MIIDRIENMADYFGISEPLDIALNYIKHMTFKDLALGRNEVQGERVFVNRMDYTTDHEETRIWEAHRTYLDIHYVAEGRETIQVSDIATMSITKPYTKDIDAALFEGKPEIQVEMKPGVFLVCFPQDVHKTGVCLQDQREIKKIVCKIAV